jgi:CheY-like chemotaxis protein
MSDAGLLLVEDDPNDVFVALRAFRRAGIESVQVAHDGAEALAMLGLVPGNGATHPRVILLDLQLPRVNGFDVLRAVRNAEETRHIPVVVVSTSADASDVRRAYQLGANSYVVKRGDASRPGGYFTDIARYWLEINRPPAPGARPS